MDRPADRPNPAPAARVPGWDMRIAGVLFLGWIVLARAGPMLEIAPGVRAWYPPAALLAAACIMWGLRALLPIVAASSALLIALPVSYEPLWRVLVVSAFLKLVYWAATFALKRWPFDCTFSTPVDVARFGAIFVLAGGTAALLNTLDLVGLDGTLQAQGWLLLRGFWIGDVVAVIALAPAIIVASHWVSEARGTSVVATLESLRARWSPGLALRMLSIPVALLVAAALAPSVGFFAFALCFLPLGWIALSYGARVAALANVVLTVGAVSLVHGSALVAPKGLEVQAFIGMLALTGLLVGSVA
ncbi:MAG TPA: MASE1 domain-containing protein, partial [Gemmatimonadaceae bacterium]|nr:MASE1 domain-containing protein [Gemmatimonadaceae bacterium]